jgi:hypothetical protein
MEIGTQVKLRYKRHGLHFTYTLKTWATIGQIVGYIHGQYQVCWGGHIGVITHSHDELEWHAQMGH